MMGVNKFIRAKRQAMHDLQRLLAVRRAILLCLLHGHCRHRRHAATLLLLTNHPLLQSLSLSPTYAATERTT